MRLHGGYQSLTCSQQLQLNTMRFCNRPLEVIQDRYSRYMFSARLALLKLCIYQNAILNIVPTLTLSVSPPFHFLSDPLPLSPSGPADYEGKPGGHRRKLRCARSADEDGLQINQGRLWFGPRVCRTQATCGTERRWVGEGVNSLPAISPFVFLHPCLFISQSGMLESC